MATNLEAYAKTPSPETTASSSRRSSAERRGQAKWLVHGLRERLSHPNVHVYISRELIAQRIAQPIDESRPVHDCILGTDVYGTAHVVGQTDVALIPAENVAKLDILFKGRIDTPGSVGYHGPVQIFSDSTAQIEARKHLLLTPENLVLSPPASAQAQMSTTISSIVSVKGRAFIEKFAWKKAAQQKPEAECVAARHAEQQFSQRMDQQAAEMIAKANSDMTTQLRQPLVERNLFPEVFRFGRRRTPCTSWRWRRPTARWPRRGPARRDPTRRPGGPGHPVGGQQFQHRRRRRDDRDRQAVPRGDQGASRIAARRQGAGAGPTTIGRLPSRRSRSPWVSPTASSRSRSAAWSSTPTARRIPKR